MVGFIDFLVARVGIDPRNTVQPMDSEILDFSYNMALEEANPIIAQISQTLYDMAFYNLATDIMINYGHDISGSDMFSSLRKQFDIGGNISGVVNSTSDNGTGLALTMPNFTNDLLPGDLQHLKTPYGRAYQAIAIKYGQIVGLS